MDSSDILLAMLGVSEYGYVLDDLFGIEVRIIREHIEASLPFRIVTNYRVRNRRCRMPWLAFAVHSCYAQ